MNLRRSPKVTEEAHGAAVRIYSEDLTEPERLAILKRCEEDPVFKARFVEAHQLLDALDEWRDELREDVVFRRFAGDSWPARRWFGRHAAMAGIAAGALLAVAVLAAAIAYFDDTGDAVIRHTTSVGERRSVTLEDGSTITLNTASQVLVGMTDAERRIVMDRGEAYFEVASDPMRPFTVEVGGRSVTARGTEFNLRRVRNGFTVALIAGRLAVHRQGEEPPPDPPWLDLERHPEGIEPPIGEAFGLRDGMIVDFDARHQIFKARHEPDIERQQLWRSGRLSFEDQPLSVVIAELGRYSVKPIWIRDQHIGAIRVFGTFKVDSIDDALSTLEKAVPIRVVPTLSGIAILAADQESSLGRSGPPT